MAKASRIWLTRPYDDSMALCRTLAMHGIDSFVAPVMEIAHSPVTPQSFDMRPDALLLTSRHAAPALRLLPVSWRDVPVFCVGTATAERATQAEFDNVIVGDADVLELLPQLRQRLPAGSRVLYLAGEETRVDVVTLLASQHITAIKQVVYEATDETTLDALFCEQFRKGEISGVVFFSPRSAQIATHLLAAHTLTEHATQCDAYCLSLAVAQAAAMVPWRNLKACHTPTTQAMVDLLVSSTVPVL